MKTKKLFLPNPTSLKSMQRFFKQKRIDLVPQFHTHKNIDFDEILELARKIDQQYDISIDPKYVDKIKKDFQSLFNEKTNEYSQVKINQYFQTYQQISQLLTNLHTCRKLQVKIHKNCIYYGELLNNQRHGRGIIIFFNGKLYEGYFQNNQFNGLGLFMLSNGSIYKGSFVNSKPDGEGQYKWPSGEIYSGQWKNGVKSGFGIWRGQKGDYYLGEWWNGFASGFGQHVWHNGDNFVGELMESLKHGYGCEEFQNGDRYQGNYLKGRPCGNGEYHWKNGAQYKGQFFDGLRCGKGQYYKKVGFLENYDGDYLNDQKDGFGEYVWQNGTKYKGNYLKDKRSGYGQIEWNDGTSYSGQWLFGKMHGQGQMIKDDKIIKGLWKNNQFMGQNNYSVDQFNPGTYESPLSPKDYIPPITIDHQVIAKKSNPSSLTITTNHYSLNWADTESYSQNQTRLMTKNSIEMPRLISLQSPKRYTLNLRTKLSKKKGTTKKSPKYYTKFMTQYDEEPYRQKLLQKSPKSKSITRSIYDQIPSISIPMRAQSLQINQNSLLKNQIKISPREATRLIDQRDKKSHWIPAGHVQSLSPLPSKSRIKYICF